MRREKMRTTAPHKRAAVPRGARISGSKICVSLNFRIERNKEAEDTRARSQPGGEARSRAEAAPGTPSQSHISPRILVYEDHIWVVMGRTRIMGVPNPPRRARSITTETTTSMRRCPPFPYGCWPPGAGPYSARQLPHEIVIRNFGRDNVESGILDETIRNFGRDNQEF